jgi:hypothetical protein
MSRPLSLGFLSALIVYGLSVVFAPPALAAVNCDVQACINKACKGKMGSSIQACNSSCQITIADRKKSGQCK